MASIIAAGCTTDRSSEGRKTKYPAGSVVIDNRTPYMLDVMSNGSPWMVEKFDGRGRFLLMMPARAYPGQPPLVLGIAADPVVIKIRALQFRSHGCLPQEVVVGNHVYGPVLERAPDPYLIVVRKGDLSAH